VDDEDTDIVRSGEVTEISKTCLSLANRHLEGEANCLFSQTDRHLPHIGVFHYADICVGRYLAKQVVELLLSGSE
jgi:hypothetical protein